MKRIIFVLCFVTHSIAFSGEKEQSTGSAAPLLRSTSSSQIGSTSDRRGSVSVGALGSNSGAQSGMGSPRIGINTPRHLHSGSSSGSKSVGTGTLVEVPGVGTATSSDQTKKDSPETKKPATRSSGCWCCVPSSARVKKTGSSEKLNKSDKGNDSDND